ncbi:MAG: hypothetical protein ABI720_06140 [Actinomycetes bacterium]
MNTGDTRTNLQRAAVPARILAVLLSLTVGGLALAPTANAAVEPRDRVYASYLPTVDQMTGVYPFLADGKRFVGKYKGQGDKFSCWDWTSAFKAADGRWSFYALKNGANPYFRGLEDPAVFAFKFHTRAQAQSAFSLQKRFARKCMGRQSADGTIARLWRQHVPAVGQGSVAYRSLEKVETGSGHRKSREFHVSVLRGRYLVNIYNQAKSFQPETKNGVRLAKVTIRNIG